MPANKSIRIFKSIRGFVETRTRNGGPADAFERKGERACTSWRRNRIKLLAFLPPLSIFLVLNLKRALAQSSAFPDADRLNDFIEYWAAARLLLAGGNPYSPQALHAIQRSLGWESSFPLIMWNPPWTLSLLLPFGTTDFVISQFAWLIMQTFILLFSAAQLWRIYGHTQIDHRTPWFIALTFVPADIAVISGQIGPLILLGIMGFLYFEKRGAWFLAGASTALISVKPHLLYLFWLALLFWVIQRRCWRVVLGGVAASLTLAIIPLLFNADVYSDYVGLWHSKTVPTPYHWQVPTLGYLLQVLLGLDDGKILYLPAAVGSVWFFYYWRLHKDHWSWPEQTPLILLVSLATAAYTWSFDQVVLLPAIMQGAARVIARDFRYRIIVVALYVLINVSYLSMMLIVGQEFWYFWMVPVLLGTHLILLRS